MGLVVSWRVAAKVVEVSERDLEGAGMWLRR